MNAVVAVAAAARRGPEVAMDIAADAVCCSVPGSRVAKTRPGSILSIEPSNANGKQQAGVGQARNRLPRAVERTVPFEMIVQSMVITWYALYGYDPADVTDRANDGASPATSLRSPDLFMNRL